jgi:hypothetical protein
MPQHLLLRTQPDPVHRRDQQLHQLVGDLLLPGQQHRRLHRLGPPSISEGSATEPSTGELRRG